MKLIRKANEDEMILEFLKGKLNSKRFNGSLDNIINDLRLDSSIIFNGNIKNKKENLDRLNIMKKFRGYPDNGLFENFPKISEWKYLELDEKDIDNIYYIDYDYWNELSNGTSKPVEAAKVINSGREIYNVSNHHFLMVLSITKQINFHLLF
ncbi:MAG: hypothetical protein ACLUGB_06075 [Bacilli bacterium]|jgi:hypothetical protein